MQSIQYTLYEKLKLNNLLNHGDTVKTLTIIGSMLT